ncbi:MAG TPA: LysR family transcriptional regulator, partial [Nitrospirae bacterium]|nr:LysR family transcriptional regulator [Nitrospirota bacterium]
QPTVSEHIKNLESELDYRLFDRVSRTVIPTREAEIIYPKAMQIIEDLEKLKQAHLLPFNLPLGYII